jgi:hypothetical protein
MTQADAAPATVDKLTIHKLATVLCMGRPWIWPYAAYKPGDWPERSFEIAVGYRRNGRSLFFCLFRTPILPFSVFFYPCAAGAEEFHVLSIPGLGLFSGNISFYRYCQKDFQVNIQPD